MSDLTRRRHARMLGLSGSHLVAGALGIVLVSGISYGLGVWTGRAADRTVAPQWRTVDGVPDDELVELLARVESSARYDGGVGELTFPEALHGEMVGPWAVPSATVAPSEPVRVAPGRSAAALADPVPDGAFTVLALAQGNPHDALRLRDTLLQAGLPAWLGIDIVAGLRTYRVAVGGFPDEASALGVLPEVEQAVEGSGAARPRVVPLP